MALPPLRRLVATLVVPALLAAAPAGAASFVEFETGQVRPLALSPDGSRLFAVNTPDGRLEIFDLSSGALVHTASVPVGMEPCAVAARTGTEVWVVNHLSDSVSIVDLSSTPPRVVRTLLVGDEPRDVVFAGPGGTRAFVTTAHRGQNVPFDPQLTTPGVGRADVWVFDATNLGPALGGTPLTVVTLFGDTPRALAASPDGGTVYAAVFESGNQTTALPEGVVCNGGASAPACTVGGVTYPGGLPAPNTNFQAITGPETGLIVKFNPADGHWEDTIGRSWDGAVRFSLPDEDVFAIDASANPPAETAAFAHVGTILFNMVANPVSGKVYVSNTDAHNEVRFEGPGVFGHSSVHGHLHESRITVLDGTAVTPHHLNGQIDYAVVPSPAGTADASLAIPTGMAVTSDGRTLYVAAFGSGVVGVFGTAQLESGAFVPSQASHIAVGGGPSGLVLDEPRGRLYVLTRFDDAVVAIDTASRAEVAHVALHDPEPPSIVGGRHFLYDARFTSSNGEASCASCHVFGDFDSLAWDLGDPDSTVENNPNPIRVPDPFGRAFKNFHPLKGPMTTQTLRGMVHDGPMHWRGDRTAGNDPGGNPLDSTGAFEKFNAAFADLLGRSGPLDDDDMAAFTQFVLQVTLPPNPIRNLDDSLTSDQQAGRSFFLATTPSDVFQPCHGCHAFDPSQAHFGTDGFSSFENEPQFVKIPHLRNLYQKVGMFGAPQVPFDNPGNNGFMGDQVRGFGFLHDGSVDTVLRFLNATVFNQTNAGGFGVNNPGGFPNGAAGDPLRAQVEQFVLAFDSDLAPIVGQQVTLTATDAGAVGPRIDLLRARASVGECDLVVKGTLAGEARGWLFDSGASAFLGDRASDPPLADTALRAQAATPGQELTYTCVPPGSGRRVAIDRDEDGFLDRDELDAGTDPADPTSYPGGPAPRVLVRATALALRDGGAARRFSFTSSTAKDAAANRIVPPPPGGAGDPTAHGAVLTVYNASGMTNDAVTVTLPASGWRGLGRPAGARGWAFQDRNASHPIASVVVKPNRIAVRGGKGGWTYTLNEPAQGRVAVSLALGTSTRWCAAAPAKLSGKPATTAKNDRVGRFTAAPKTPPPPVCPGVP